ncbi:STAS domain-containing protein [Thermomonospora umbrina]|uniref:Anti-anti-sigma factor n=1 Tax=Thermomonospora umbrina TaxID=111806 RepID=A0A3D9SP45_9ACTN|nr:STAS domain-containing protein [Thermomonospora umbrina]REE97719.1 anti-anti-sigma factor [Thermomonospora umbrina]
MKNKRRTISERGPSAVRPPALRVRVHRAGSDLFVQPVGELGARTVDLLREPLSAVLRAVPSPRMVLDLSRVRLSDRFGLGVLVALRNLARQVGGRLIIAGPAADLVALLSDTGLDRHLQFCATLELAAGVPISTRPGRLPLRGTGAATGA